jgi:hypothetical protein
MTINVIIGSVSVQLMQLNNDNDHDNDDGDRVITTLVSDEPYSGIVNTVGTYSWIPQLYITPSFIISPSFELA